jgi:hypothetical protein
MRRNRSERLLSCGFCGAWWEGSGLGFVEDAGDWTGVGSAEGLGGGLADAVAAVEDNLPPSKRRKPSQFCKHDRTERQPGWIIRHILVSQHCAGPNPRPVTNALDPRILFSRFLLGLYGFTSSYPVQHCTLYTGYQLQTRRNAPLPNARPRKRIGRGIGENSIMCSQKVGDSLGMTTTAPEI